MAKVVMAPKGGFLTPLGLHVTRIGTRGGPHRLGKPKEESTMTRPTFQKILDDHVVFPQGVHNCIYKNICKIGK
jgi:hypothetical protein